MARFPRSGCTARTTLHLVGPQSWTAVRVRFGSGAADDRDFDDEFDGDGGGVEWLLSRELLRAGLSGPVGDGDVRIWPARGGLDVLFLQLRAPSGEALFELSAGVVGDFLRESELLVPAGTESATLRV